MTREKAINKKTHIAAEDFSDKEIQSWGINLDLLALIGLMN